MTPQQQDLLTRIEGFSFDEPGTVFTFAQRLARENGWSASYTRRVLREYGRFVFLAMEAGHPVCPSEDVDQAWHQHLIFTQNYWEDFCGQALGKPLHHGPTRGGKSEAVKHHAMYAQTLAAYRAWFGEEPPGDIWPPSERRFGEGASFVRVNRRDVWLIPKPRWPRAAALFAMAAGAFTFAGAKPAEASLPASGFPIIDLPGPEFLIFYIIVALFTMVVAAALRASAAKVATCYSSQNELKDPYLIATLTGGPNLAVYAAISELVRRGLLSVPGPDSISRIVGAVAPADLHAFELAVWNAVPDQHIISIHEIRRQVELETNALRDVLVRGEFLLPEERQEALSGRMSKVFAPLLVLGAIKMFIGIAREKPVFFLVLLLLGTFIALLAFRRRLMRTSLGDEALLALRSQYTIRGVHDLSFGTPDPATGMVPLAIALYGLPILFSSPLSGLESSLVPAGELKKHTGNWPDGCGSSCSAGLSSGCSGGSSGCAGGGGCGSGCGGGGCGGCGGS